MYCAVCGQSESKEWFDFSADDDESTPRIWLLCASCAQSVRHELERMQLRSPARVRIAIAMVASEHASAAAVVDTAAHSGNRGEHLLIGVVLAAFLVHALVFLFVIAFIATSH